MWFWCKFGATLYRAILSKLQEIISTFVEISKSTLLRQGAFLSLAEQLSLPLRASEVILDSEVHFVSEVSPTGEVMGKLNFTWCIKVAKQLCQTSLQSNFTFTLVKTSPITTRKTKTIPQSPSVTASRCGSVTLGLWSPRATSLPLHKGAFFIFTRGSLW